MPTGTRRQWFFRTAVLVIVLFSLSRGVLWAKRYYACHRSYEESRPEDITKGSLEWNTVGIALGDDETRVAELLGRLKTPGTPSPRMKSVSPPWAGFMRSILVNHGSTDKKITNTDCIREEISVYFDEAGKARIVSRSVTDFFRVFGPWTRNEHVDLASKTIHEDDAMVFGSSRS